MTDFSVREHPSKTGFCLQHQTGDSGIHFTLAHWSMTAARNSGIVSVLIPSVLIT